MAIVVTTPTEGTTPAAYRTYVEALEAISRTEVSGADIGNRFAMFDKTPVEYGAQIQQIRVGTGKAADVNRKAANSAADYAKLHTRVFQGWTEKRFDTDIKLNDLKSVCGSPEDLAALVAANENRNAESERLDAEDIYYNLIANPGNSRAYDSLTDPEKPATLLSSFGYKGAGTSDTFVDGTKVSGWLADNGLFEKLEFTAEDTRDARLTKILEETRRIAKDMTNNNATYTHTADNQRFGARMSDLVVLAPQDFINALDIRVRASIRNLEFVDLPEVVETDFPTLRGYEVKTGDEWKESPANALDAIIILDRRAIGRVVKDREEYADWVQARRATQHTTFLEDLFYYSEVYKAYAILYKKKDIE